MITWFQRTFAKHNKWLLMGILGVLLLSFIVGIGAVPRGSLAATHQNKQLFLGVDITNAEQMQEMARAVEFTYDRLYGQRIDTQQQLGLLLDQRVALKYLADQWQIPDPTPKQIEDYVRTLSAFRSPDGTFSTELYTIFHDEVQASPPAERDEDAAVLAEDCRLDRVRQILGGPGYSLPGNAQTLLLQIQNSQDNFNYSLEAATMDLTKFEPKIESDQAKLLPELQKLFDSDPGKFPQPAQAQLSYVKFPAAKIAAPTADELHDYATKHKDDYPGITTGTLTQDDWAKVNTAWSAEQKDAAETAAKTATMDCARELYSLQTSVDKPEFAAFLKKYNLTLRPLPMMTQGQPAPADSPIPDDTLQQVAFNLNAQQFFTPVPLPDGAGIIFLIQSTPARPSTFDEAKVAVLKAYTEQEKAKQYNAHGEEVSAAITKDMAAGKSFHDAALAQQLVVKDYADVSDPGLRDAAEQILSPDSKDTTPTSPLAAMGRDLLAALGSPDANGVPFLLTLHLGEVSKMMMGADTGVIFHVTQREPAKIEVDSPAVKQLREFMTSQQSAYDAGLSLTRLLQAAQAAQAATKPAGS
jgi:hypothetical protein